MTIGAKLTDDKKTLVIEMTTAEAHSLVIWLLNLGFLKPGTVSYDLRQALREVILKGRIG